MGLFDFFKINNENSNSKEVIIYAPLNGKVIDLSEVPDEAFSQRMIGDGVAIEPTEGKLHSPINGNLADIFPTNHATVYESKEGIEMIVHFGVDTVKLNGEGFTRLRESGSCKVGEEIIAYDLNAIKEKVPSVKTPVIINNMDIVKSIEVLAMGKDVKVGDAIFKVILK